MDSTPFASTAQVYDLLYEAAGKDYAAESASLHELIQSRNPGASSLLDVACGTGAHLAHLRAHYDVVGVDLEPAMLARARQRMPDVTLVQADMVELDLDRRFDAITCLFSAIGYLRSAAALDRTIAGLSEHLEPGGVIVIDGWIRPDAWRDPGTVHALAGLDDGVAAARVARTHRDGAVTTLEMHHLLATLTGVDHIVETHQLTLFTDDEYRSAFERAGLAVDVVDSPHRDRDRYVGVLPRSGP